VAKTTEVRVSLTDDLDGSKADRTVRFSLDSHAYEIDLSKKNAGALEKAIAPYIAAARRPERRTLAAARSARRSRPSAELAAIREWAHANGYAVGDRGRVPGDVVAAFRAAQ
jgi:hypothetical protein